LALSSLRLSDVRISDETVRENERMLTGGFYAEIELGYDATIAQEKGGRPFQANAVRPIQLSTRGVLNRITEGRAKLTTAQWKDFLLRSVGLEPGRMSLRARDISLMRMIPFVERNYNMIELGRVAPARATFISRFRLIRILSQAAKRPLRACSSTWRMDREAWYVNTTLSASMRYPACPLTKKDGVNIMKGYMESGEFSRGRESIRADGSIVLLGNFDVDVQHQQRVGHLFGPLPPEMRNDAAFMDRVHAYLPGRDVPKVSRDLFTDNFGLVSDVLAEAFTRLRVGSRAATLMGRVHFGGALSGRDQNAATKTITGLLKLIQPDGNAVVPDEELEWAVRLALEMRRRVKEQQKRFGTAEFRNVQFSYSLGPDGVEHFVATPELQSEDSIGGDPLPAGQAWAISPGGQSEPASLFRIEVTEAAGSGVRILNQSPPAPFRESIRIAEQDLYGRAQELVGDRNPREHEFAEQLRSFDSGKSGANLGVPALAAFCSALLNRPLKGGLAVIGGLNLGGSIEIVPDPLDLVELAIEKGAAAVLMPVSCRRGLVDLSDEAAAKIQTIFYPRSGGRLTKGLARRVMALCGSERPSPGAVRGRRSPLRIPAPSRLSPRQNVGPNVGQTKAKSYKQLN
jgi:ATP-dependent Lon protease